MNPLPTTRTRPRGTRSAPRRTQASGSTIAPRPVGPVLGQRRPIPGVAHARRTRRAGSSAPRSARRSTRGPRGSARTSPHDAWWTSATRRPSPRLRDDLVAEHGARVRGVELLDVGAAQPAREDAHRARRGRPARARRRARAPRPVDDDRAHGRIVRRRMAVKLHRCPRHVAGDRSHPCWRVQPALDDR